MNKDSLGVATAVCTVVTSAGGALAGDSCEVTAVDSAGCDSAGGGDSFLGGGVSFAGWEAIAGGVEVTVGWVSGLGGSTGFTTTEVAAIAAG